MLQTFLSAFRLFRKFFPVLAVLLGACNPARTTPSPTASPVVPTLPPPVMSEEVEPSSAPQTTSTPAAIDLPAPAYTLTAIYDDARHTLSALEEIAYTNRSGESIAEILLVVDASVYPGVFRLNAIESGQGPSVTQTSWERIWLHVGLDRPLAPGEVIHLKLDYELILPARIADASLRPMVFGWSERQINLVDWYPYLPPYQPGQGWLVHPPGFYGEHQVYEASDFTVNLQVVHAPAELVVAASAPERREGEWRHYQLLQARTFALSLSPLYQTVTRQAGGVAVNGYFFPAHRIAGEAAVQTAAEALELFGNLFAPYPRETLAVVEADFLDGMEYDGLFFLSNGFYNLYSGAPGDYLVALAAHETAHQWWYGLVGNDQALEPWLDEALCTYSEKLYYESRHPEALSWWWEVRVRYYQPRGFVDDSIYNPHGEAQAYRAYRDAVYLNGAIFLDRLRQQVGDEAFFAFLKDYAGRFSKQVATGKDFFRVLRAHSSADLSGLLGEYFQSTP